jgi:hypothetical protein
VLIMNRPTSNISLSHRKKRSNKTEITIAMMIRPSNTIKGIASLAAWMERHPRMPRARRLRCFHVKINHYRLLSASHYDGLANLF